MPNVILLMTDSASRLMTETVFETISAALAEAVSDSLGLGGPEDVVVYQIVAQRAFNANPVQVICIASHSESRLEKLVDLRDSMAAALASLVNNPPCAAFYEIVGGKFESWPMMPYGSWAEVVLG